MVGLTPESLEVSVEKREQELNVVLYFEGHLSLSVFNRRISSFSDDSFVHF